MCMTYSKANPIKMPFETFAEKEYRTQAHFKQCEAANCPEEGVFPAPRTRQALRDYRWFCLDHVREYNKRWNYFSGMEGAALEQAIRAASTWERPSWKFGSSGKAAPSPDDFDDMFGFFDDEPDAKTASRLGNMDKEERAAWALFGIDPTDDSAILKKRYNQLVKIHHPDRHQGDSKAEEKLKEINLAYSLLRNKQLNQ